MEGASILVVEDEKEIRELVALHLAKEGFRVQTAGSGEQAQALLVQNTPSLVVLDILLPGIDGLSLCRQLKTDPRTRGVAVILLTAKGEETDIVAGLTVGADDYIAKPFSPRVLVARVKAVLRRASRQPTAEPETDDSQCIAVHDLKIHVGRHEVLVAGEPVELTATEFRILHFLARRPGWVFSRQQILDGLYGDSCVVTERAVDVQIVGLRKKLGMAGSYIQTVRGVGYRFKP